ncbi:MAG: NAD-dependent succinate-semialdehyde dehydrogenase [Planctomycetaceae bacterium]|nr:NAD-dependent succinate-semialdehyde dehydrogenase [Planctomycetaceae bacterium]
MKTVPDFWFEPHPWINGSWQPGSESVTVSNPATGSPLAQVTRASAAQVNLAIDGAAKVFTEWRQRSAVERGNILKRIATLLLERKDPLACLLTAEQGKPYPQAVAEIEYSASFFQWFGEEARRLYGRVVPHPEADREFIIEHKPIGVAGLITPWNFPLAQAAKKISAALAVGCTAVWKPAEATPLIALAVAPLFREAGVPDGAIQIVPGRGSVIGNLFADHPAVRVLSLTGSTSTGSSLMAAAARGIKRVSLELGGNAPFIILPDADLAFAAEQLCRLKLFVSGQVCVTANRIFVHRDIAAAFVDLVAQRLSSAHVGNGLAEGIDAGPLIHHHACTEVGTLVEQSLQAGARCVVSNRSYEADRGNAAGAFYPPTLLTDVKDDMPIAQQEIFGPIIPVLQYVDYNDVVQRANATPYGLAGYVFGGDLSRCRAIASGLDVGIVGVNEWRPLKAEIPFGGVKQSGIGAEGGEEGIREFLDTQVISLPKPKY